MSRICSAPHRQKHYYTTQCTHTLTRRHTCRTDTVKKIKGASLKRMQELEIKVNLPDKQKQVKASVFTVCSCVFRLNCVEFTQPL